MTRTTARKLIIRIALALVAAAAVFALTASSSAAATLKTPADRFVRTANYYLRAGTDITSEHYASLAKYDLLVFPAEAQVYNRAMFKKLRELNPTIIILAYVPSKSYNYGWNDELHLKLRTGIQDDWWLMDTSGNHISVWGNTAVVSGASQWNAYLPRFVSEEIWSTGLWDGVFYDEFSNNISWVNGGDIDLHRDGIRDDLALADTAWRRGMINILRNTRELLGAEAVIITNGDSTDELQPHVNGRMFESFPTPWEAGGTWQGVMANYLRLPALTGYPPVMVINANTGNSGNNADYRKMRFSLCSTLLGDGFFSFDFGETDHGQLWRYDEQDVRLGQPLGAPVNVLTPAKKNVIPGVWRRDFQNGVVLVNSTSQPQKIAFGQDLEKLRGTQSPETNDGSLVSDVTLPASDGLILLKPIEKLIGSAFSNGAYARIFDSRGTRVRNGFFSYVAPFAGQSTVLLEDMDKDGTLEKMIASKGLVSVYSDSGTLLTSFRPYGDEPVTEISLAVGDVNGDGKTDIVTGAGAGSAPLIRMFEADGSAIGQGFHAYDSRFRGGVQVAVGDVNGDGKDEIVTGVGPGGGPHVRVFNRFGRNYTSFFAYDSRFRGGVRVAAGDLDGDGKDEIVTGAGPGGGPHVRIFNLYGRPLGPGFFSSDPNSRNGVRVATADVNGDGKDEIAALTTDVFQFSLAQ